MNRKQVHNYFKYIYSTIKIVHVLFSFTAVTTTQFLFVGTLKSYGIFFVEILDVFKESVSVTSIITGIQSGVYCIVCKYSWYSPFDQPKTGLKS